MEHERPARRKMRRAVDALVATPEPICARIEAAQEHFGQLNCASELPAPAERLLYHRIASSLVSGGDDNQEGEDYDEGAAIAESIAALGDDVAIMVARDMLHLYELVGSAPDMDAQWPREWPAA